MASEKRYVEVYDTTLRDGTQGENVSLSLEDKLLIAERLDALGVDYIEGGYPLSNPKDAAFFQQVAGRNIRRAKITAFGMTRRRGVKAAEDTGMRALIDSGAPVCTIVGKTWDLHVEQVLRVDLDENLRMIAESCEVCARAGREVIYDAEHFFDGYRANPAYAVRTLQAALDGGAARLVLCDTNGGSLPEFVAECVCDALARLPRAKLGIHTHNDSGLAVANSLAAIVHGAVHVQGTINGLGERCGNADLTTVVPNLVLKYGFDCGMGESLRSLTEVSRYVYELANLNMRENQPFVGLSAFAHKGGMHVHAVQRNTSTYEHVNPELVGNTRRILVSELSGASNIAAKAGAKFHIDQDRDAQKRILERVMELEAEGWQFESADASFELLVRRTLGGQWYPGALWELDHFRCNILRQNGHPATTEGVVRLKVGGRDEYTVAEGDGPVNALDAALRKALSRHYPAIDALHLDDYKVRVVNATAETAAKVRVLIRFHDGEHSFSTVGVSENIIEASWLALVDAIEYTLLREADAAKAPPAAAKA